jgi:hypothetical protein
MKTLDRTRFALTMGAAAALLAGCGGSQPPIRRAGLDATNLCHRNAG